MQTIIRGVPTITDSDLERIGRANPGYKIERDDDGSLVVSPTNADGHDKEAEALHQLRTYQALAGGRAGGASGGFINPRGGVNPPTLHGLATNRSRN